MNKDRLRNVAGLIMAMFILAMTFTHEARSLWTAPSLLKTTVGDHIPFNKIFPPIVQKYVTLEVINGKNNSVFASNIGFQDTVTNQAGRFNVTMRFFGLLPVKNLVVDVMPPVKLIPGGHSIGVVLQSKGIMVVGLSPIIDQAGVKHYPARDLGVKVGDAISRVNGKTVRSDAELAHIVDSAGRNNDKITVEWFHEGEPKTQSIQPILCGETKRYRIGLFVRDKAAGVGTMTFFDPRTNAYGALGHVICDADTNQRIDIKDGRVIPAAVRAIQPGKKGIPGEKIGSFLEEKGDFSGQILKNTTCGIFGKLDNSLSNPFYPDGLPIGLSAQIELEEAEILTVVNGEKLEKFQIKIERVMPYRTDGKGLVIRITDPKLLETTGGIVQGMSGSPIIQNGRIIGAVTHVFISDPSQGYGVLIDNMLKEAGLLSNNDETRSSQAPSFLLA